MLSSLSRVLKRSFSALPEGRQSGIVKFFNVTKGFGFITPENGGGDVFVHQSNIHAKGFRSLGEGEQVEFEIGSGEDGRAKALNVTGPQGDYVKGVPRDEVGNFASAGPRFPKGGGSQRPSQDYEW